MVIKYYQTLSNSLSLSKGNKLMSFPARSFTGKSMTLTCGPPDINIGEISGSMWKFNGREIKDGDRIDIISSIRDSKVTVNDVILADSGK